MSVKPFSKMNKAELQAAVKSLKLEDKVAEIAADPEAPINAEYVTVLEEYKAAQDELNADVVAEQEATKAAEQSEDEVLKTGQKATTEDKVAYNEVMTRVVITDHENKYVIEDDEHTRTFPVTYGNRFTGAQTFNIILSGDPQYVPNAVLKRLKEIRTTEHLKGPKGEPMVRSIERFKVTEVAGFTQDQLDALKEKQRTRL